MKPVLKKKYSYRYASVNLKLSPEEVRVFKEKAKLYAGGKLTALIRAAVETYAPRKV